jgi:poly(glycerol-phosphate) alpha-glucosyltransferase
MDVRVFGTQDEFTAEDLAAWSPVAVSAFSPTWPAKFGYSPRFLEELADFAPDLTHTHGIWLYPSVVTNRYCRRNGTPYLISAHGMLDPWAIRNSRWKKLVASFLYEQAHLRGASCLRALCEAEARAIRQVGLKNPIAIIPNGIDLPGEEVESRKQKVEIEGAGRKVLLYLGRIHPKKGLVNLLRAWAAIQKSEARGRRSDWILAIAGWEEGGHEAELKALATGLGIPWADVRQQPQCNSISAFSFQLSAFSLLFLGPQFGADRAACYRACDTFILPSLSEGVPMVVLAAWAHGKPVLMTPQCNLPEGFTVGAATRVEPNAQSLEAGLLSLFGMSDSERQGMGRAGYKLTASRYAWPHVAQEMKGVYEWMLGGGAKPACLTDY